jgi:hypothetical protein
MGQNTSRGPSWYLPESFVPYTILMMSILRVGFVCGTAGGEHHPEEPVIVLILCIIAPNRFTLYHTESK